MNEQERKERIEYQTYLLKINLDNIKSNYDYLMEETSNMLKMNDNELLEIFRNNTFDFHDTIDFDYIDIKEMREYLEDFKESYIDYEEEEEEEEEELEGLTITDIWDYITNKGIATQEELELVTSINGYSIESLNDIIYARTGFHDIEQYENQ